MGSIIISLYSAVMTERNADASGEKPVFVADLFPYRSLGRRGFLALVVVTVVTSTIYGLFFIATGAWPISFFFGFDLVLLYVAFWLNYRSGRTREQVSVSRIAVLVRKFPPSGRMTEHRFNPLWARFFVRRHHEIGIVSMHIAGEGRSIDIGSFLNPDDRESFANAFKGALATVQQRI